MKMDDRAVCDELHMDHALALARMGWGQVSPNPLVGAVVVAGGEVIGEGFHARYGESHAEVNALREAGDGARGATLYVNLEPCAHEGQTPPCTDAIIRAGIRRTVYGCRDVDPLAAGGANVLREAGVEVRGGVRAGSAARLNGPFIWHHVGFGPWISVKLGLSLDGRIAGRPGLRTRITGDEAESYVHRLRAAHDAVMVGGRTVRVDDPLLTVRLAPPPRVPPSRVVLDPDLELPTDSRLADTVEEAPVVVFCNEDAATGRRRALEWKGVEVVPVPRASAGLDLGAVMLGLESRGVRSVLVEGGGRLVAGLMQAGLVRRQYLIYAPVVIGEEGVPSIGAKDLPGKQDWSVAARTALGEDTLLELEDRKAREALMEAA
ncbi:MAG: bifunctional diaminohydroxyphosphoribosylaminopyrimidine deaminase/5-amino-6-(5-phosphoribosylamino)uracil reductase RibD [Candidatus Palauibacterales bacterium]|nr:bifunctional diaminohydroxyphosphoribosylaminopyrimidine deaminase/5-amino-6-(5-phosphoribosylamino)uracil reductase RibD [Candidatus Palauibacterales bacterium]